MQKRGMIRLVTAGGLLTMVVGMLLSSSYSAAASWAWPTKPVQLAWFYKPPLNDPTGDTLSQYFDTFTLTRADEKLREDLRRKGETAPFLQYIIAAEIQDPGSCTTNPYRNQVAFKPGDYCMIRDQHPEWLMRDTSGNLITHIYGGARYVQVDPGNPGWQQFFLTRVRELQEQVDPTHGGIWDGVFLDNVDASLGRFRAIGVQPAAYPDDVTYHTAVRSFLRAIYEGYFQPQNRPLHANITEVRDGTVWDSHLDYLDGAMQEGWGVDWGSGYLTAARWEADLQRAEKTQARGKRMMTIAQGNEPTPEPIWQAANLRQQFAYASYLLVANGQAAFRYSDSPYRYIWLYENYKLDLGRPLGPRYQEGSVWRRDFERGTVTVDPVTRAATIGAKPTVTIRATDASATEKGGDTGTFTVERAGGSTNTPLTVQYSMSGTATSGTDYTALSGTATIPAGATSTTITVTPTRDNRRERSETAIATLGSGNAYLVGTPASATVTIVD